MKTAAKIIFLFIVSVILFSACEKITPPYKEKNDNPQDTTNKVTKTVLLEDYTGHTCPNCPGAAVVAHELQQTYGKDRLIVISIHAGSFAIPKPGTIYSLDLRSDAGTEWDNYFEISLAGNPNGMIDRVTYPEGRIISEAGWPAKVAEELDEEPVVDLNITNHFDNQNNSLSTTVTGEFLSALEGDYYLQVVVTEDSIIGYQKNSDPEVGSTPYIENYVFMDVLRAAVNSSWGEAVNENGSVAANDTFEKSYNLTFNPDWVPGHCHVVAFVYKNDDKSVLQAAETAVFEE